MAHGEAAQPIVLGRVEPDEGGILVERLGRGGEVAAVGADPRVVQQRDDLPVRAHDVRAVLLARHRRLAQPLVERIGVGAARRVENPLEEALR